MESFVPSGKRPAENWVSDTKEKRGMGVGAGSRHCLPQSHVGGGEDVELSVASWGGSRG